ncbi:MAG: YigZ family protein [Firmicutes bacterium]|nr:YigZ family protein [Bacillota bacterium]
MKKSGFNDAVIVVTRYFGGILLGTGGLVRAYSQAAADAVRNAGIVRFALHAVFEVSLSYQDYNRLAGYLSGIKILGCDFGENVKLRTAVEKGAEETFTFKILDETSGRALISITGEDYFSV